MVPESETFYLRINVIHIWKCNILSHTKCFLCTAESNEGPLKPNFTKGMLFLWASRPPALYNSAKLTKIYFQERKFQKNWRKQVSNIHDITKIWRFSEPPAPSATLKRASLRPFYIVPKKYKSLSPSLRDVICRKKGLITRCLAWNPSCIWSRYFNHHPNDSLVVTMFENTFYHPLH